MNWIDPEGLCPEGEAWKSEGQWGHCVPESEADYLPGNAAEDLFENCPLPQIKGVAAIKSIVTAIKKASKVDKLIKTEQIGKFTKITEVRPGKGPGQSRAEYVRYKNEKGETIRTYKDTYDRANNFQHRKNLTGGPEGRTE